METRPDALKNIAPRLWDKYYIHITYSYVTAETTAIARSTIIILSLYDNKIIYRYEVGNGTIASIGSHTIYIYYNGLVNIIIIIF